MADDGQARLSFLVRPLAPSFTRRICIIAPGCGRDFDEHEWRDALVILEHGQIELVYTDGSRQRFGHGAVLWLHGLPLRTLHNHGPQPAVLVAVSRNDPRSDAKEPE